MLDRPGRLTADLDGLALGDHGERHGCRWKPHRAGDLGGVDHVERHAIRLGPVALPKGADRGAREAVEATGRTQK